MTVFFRVVNLSSERKSGALRELIGNGSGPDLFVVETEAFSAIPGAPFAYWVSPQIRDIFSRFPAYETQDRTVRVGLQTSDDFRFVRLAWEIDSGSRDQTWHPIVKGGSFSKYYANINTLANWADDGHEIKAFAETTPGTTHWSRNIRNPEFYLQPGLTWPLRGVHFSAQAVPRGCIFSIGGKMAFAASSDLPAFLSIFNTVPFDYLLCLSAGKVGGVQYEVGLVQKTPVPTLGPTDVELLGKLGTRAWGLKRKLDSVQETSHAFILPWLVQQKASVLNLATLETELVTVEKQIEELTFNLYGLAHEDRKEIERWAASASTAPPIEADSCDDAEDEGNSPSQETAESNLSALVSWSIGVAFGRFDIRLATGERPAPPEPEPFDPLPTRSPGMIPESDEAQFPPRPLLVDDPGHPLDLATQAGDVLERVGFPPESPEALRRWLARDFFLLHIKMYSKSRRKAPIYWQLATPSASYSVWLYIHAFSRDALYKVKEIIELKLRHEERKLESLRADSGASHTAAQRKALEGQESFVEELRAFLEEVKRVAPLWNPDLDDGVIINFAPLWRLVPHHKPWQKELKATWDALCAEEYDWAHLAMHLWPERVVLKCANDRSLAIAHGLEDVFWLEGEDGKWKPRPIPARPVEELVRERTSPAVKAALEALLTAPVAPSGGGRGRPRRGRRAGGATV